MDVSKILLMKYHHYNKNKGYTDFNRYWYGVVGGSIITTLFANMFMPHCIGVVKWWINGFKRS